MYTHVTIYTYIIRYMIFDMRYVYHMYIYIYMRVYTRFLLIFGEPCSFQEMAMSQRKKATVSLLTVDGRNPAPVDR